jgi:3-hydroxyisobutyrate dehydrogenase
MFYERRKSMPDKTTVALLGTGIMGAAMARNLLEAGMEVRAWNRTPEKAEPLAEDGAKVANTPEEAAEGAEFLITMLSETEAVEDAVGDDVLPALAEDAVWLQTSTIGPEGASRLEELAATHGVAHVDAPVLGTKQPAEQGALLVLASGPEEVRERSQKVFDAIGGKTFWLGPAGAGSRLKLVVNNWIVGVIGALAETIAFAEAIGVDPARFLEVIESGPLGLPYAQLKGRMMIEEEFPTSFSLGLARKDAALVLDAAEKEGLRMAVTEAVAARFVEAIEAGHGEEDLAAVYYMAKPDRS